MPNFNHIYYVAVKHTSDFILKKPFRDIFLHHTVRTTHCVLCITYNITHMASVEPSRECTTIEKLNEIIEATQAPRYGTI